MKKKPKRHFRVFYETGPWPPTWVFMSFRRVLSTEAEGRGGPPSSLICGIHHILLSLIQLLLNIESQHTNLVNIKVDSAIVGDQPTMLCIFLDEGNKLQLQNYSLTLIRFCMKWLKFRVGQIEVNRMDDQEHLSKCTCYL